LTAHEDELLDPEQFNVGLMRHLLWHNTERPHWSLKMKPPVQFIQDNFSHPECNMYVADTIALPGGCVFQWSGEAGKRGCQQMTA